MESVSNMQFLGRVFEEREKEKVKCSQGTGN